MAQWSEEDVTALLGELGSHGFGGINPDEQQLLALLTSDEGGPLQFVNLLSYRPEARYPEDHELAGAGLRGAEAYGRYGAVALEQVVRRGGQLTLYNDVLQVLIGQSGPWDQIAVMQYPEVDTFVDMIRDPEYQAGLVHRDAGLAATAILVSRPLL
ncbi:MAG TPA: DUF1330 domain-containing protein [Acidimicrobiales bacterium]|jgi:uncharacterized protein (DUF1330 family)|nr:DUF1330 domain-containing protein [Acidimicrobiales bacterium]